jgi:pyridoxine/pyridoxamine 5'-phosphate oxidase
MEPSALYSALYNFMKHKRLGVISSISAGGQPQSALVGIAVTPLLEIVFDTVNTSRKYANLVANPSCSFAIGWDGEQTVQFEGIAAQPTGAELERCQAVYFSNWPEGRAHLSWPGIAYFVVRPIWIRYSDYDRDPPLIEEVFLNGRT